LDRFAPFLSPAADVATEMEPHERAAFARSSASILGPDSP